MSAPLLRDLAPDALIGARRAAVTPEVLGDAARIVADVRARGATAVREMAVRFGERAPDAPLVLGRSEMDAALARVGAADRGVLERTAARIEAFAAAQRAALAPLDVAVDGGRAGHTIVPITAAGCYAPAGRYPLPSSVLMTAVTARVAGCDRVVVATPNPGDVMLAAAAIAGADAVLAVGGAHAIAALAYGIEGLAPVDVIAGPGNAWVTAAKKLVYGDVAVDMLAGPSELVVLADATADPSVVAADLLAQAEHDPLALPVLVTTDASLPPRVEDALRDQLAALPTAEVARAALANGGVVVRATLDEAVRAADAMAPEHLELQVRDADAVAARVRDAGAIFVGADTAEVLGDYGAGPNHTLPTGGTARAWGGLSVFTFVRVRTWLRIDPRTAGTTELIDDVARLAAIEGLAGHRAAALRRRDAPGRASAGGGPAPRRARPPAPARP